MSRVTKDPEERREEIITAAQKLFEEKGYENTMMSDVAHTIGISQGLPYRYFKSKLELLDAVATRVGQGFVKKLIGFKFKPDMDAKEKLDIYFKMISDIGSSRLVLTLHNRDNTEIHRRLAAASFKSLMPQLKALIKEGNRQRIFDCPHVEECAEFLIYGTLSVHDLVGVEDINDKIEIIRDIFYRVLGVKG